MRVNCKSRRIGKIKPIVKYAVAVAIGTIITTTMVTCRGTQSYFTSTALAEGNMSAASPQDIITCKFERIVEPCKMIIEDVLIDFSNPDSEKIINPDKIKIYNKTGNYMIIYFALDDTISKYLRPVNPIEAFNEITETEGNTQVKVSEGEVPINVDINIEQFISILKDLQCRKSEQENGDTVSEDDDFITGEISIKYLNNYINKTQKISFSKEYLMMRFLKRIQDDLNSKLAQDESKIGSANSLGSDNAQAEGFSENIGASDSSITSAVTSEENADDTNIELTPEEQQVINYISPELLPKMNQLIENKKSLEQVIDTLQQRINDIMSQQVTAAAAASSAEPAAPVIQQTSDAPASDSTAVGSSTSDNTTVESSSTASGADSEITEAGSSSEGAASGNSSSGASTSGSPAAGDSDSASSALSGTDSSSSASSNNAAEASDVDTPAE